MAAQLLVPRLGDWCAIWLNTQDQRAAVTAPRLARVWHANEQRIIELKEALERDALKSSTQAIPIDSAAQTMVCPLVAAGKTVGRLLLAWEDRSTRIPDEVATVVGDLARRVAVAVTMARRYTQQANTSRVLQRGLLPRNLPIIPGLDQYVVYEPMGEYAWAGGDFYDIFQPREQRWRFALGDVCGHGPEAAVVTGMVRPLLRVLAEEGYGVARTLDRLNRIMVEDTPTGNPAYEEEGIQKQQVRSLSLLYGELIPLPPGAGGGFHCRIASAGHPLPLLLHPNGETQSVAEPQVLLGIMDHTAYQWQTFTLAPGDTLVCVTDGVNERRCGRRQFDDDDGLSKMLGECAGMGAASIGEKIRRRVHAFASAPPEDDLALLIFQPAPMLSTCHSMSSFSVAAPG
ncbi:PP2C family protein-serine/threonine phosphatase [Streptomyces sp. NPDC058572]|uniref:PP2C family protein-serine/threonine phosphatase n=1 Tax=Streptomyces sp. NPDC058572 TaxID=3346546 RepID=UPI00365414E8